MIPDCRPCPSCGSYVRMNTMGWGRCRYCGTETLRDSDTYSSDELRYVDAAVAGFAERSSAVRERGEAADALGLSLFSTSDKAYGDA